MSKANKREERNFFKNPICEGETFFDIANLKRDASKKDLKNAYIRLSRRYHPDKNKEAEATKIFQSINDLYEKATNPDMVEIDYASDNFDTFNRGESKVTEDELQEVFIKVIRRIIKSINPLKENIEVVRQKEIHYPFREGYKIGKNYSDNLFSESLDHEERHQLVRALGFIDGEITSIIEKNKGIGKDHYSSVACDTDYLNAPIINEGFAASLSNSLANEENFEKALRNFEDVQKFCHFLNKLIPQEQRETLTARLILHDEGFGISVEHHMPASFIYDEGRILYEAQSRLKKQISDIFSDSITITEIAVPLLEDQKWRGSVNGLFIKSDDICSFMRSPGNEEEKEKIYRAAEEKVRENENQIVVSQAIKAIEDGQSLESIKSVIQILKSSETQFDRHKIFKSAIKSSSLQTISALYDDLQITPEILNQENFLALHQLNSRINKDSVEDLAGIYCFLISKGAREDVITTEKSTNLIYNFGIGVTYNQSYDFKKKPELSEKIEERKKEMQSSEQKQEGFVEKIRGEVLASREKREATSFVEKLLKEVAPNGSKSNIKR
jgi:hypothetical protein